MAHDAAIEALALALATGHRAPDVVRRFAHLNSLFPIFAVMHNTTNLHWEIIVTP